VDHAAPSWATPLPASGLDRLRALALPTLLMIVAALGVHRAATLHQSSWQGVSFGMFATYDNTTSRIVRVTVESDDGPQRVDLPPDLRDDATRLRVVPTEGMARALARAVLTRVGATRGHEVRVEVWRLVLRDGDGGLRLRLEPLVAGAARP
jgi:hypothetical protein